MLYELVNGFLDHDMRFVALAVAICFLSNFTGAAIAQYSMRSDVAKRRRWLLMSGIITGLGIWTTHLTAMLGYRTDLNIHFDLVNAFISFLLAIGITIVGGVMGLLRGKGVLAGLSVGIGISVAHFVDMQGLRISGVISHDPVISAISLIIGIWLASFAGYLLVNTQNYVFAWPGAVALSSAVLLLHFIGMGGLTVIPSNVPLEATKWVVSAHEISTLVVAALLIMLSSAIGYTWHSVKLSRSSAEEQRRLSHAFELLRETQAHHKAYIELNPQIAWGGGSEWQHHRNSTLVG